MTQPATDTTKAEPIRKATKEEKRKLLTEYDTLDLKIKELEDLKAKRNVVGKALFEIFGNSQIEFKGRVVFMRKTERKGKVVGDDGEISEGSTSYVMREVKTNVAEKF